MYSAKPHPVEFQTQRYTYMGFQRSVLPSLYYNYLCTGLLTLWVGTSNAQNVYRPGFPLAPPGAASGQNVYRPAFPLAPAGAIVGSGEDVSASIPGLVLLNIRAIHLTKKISCLKLRTYIKL
jgi:hypothetical protein